MAVTLKDYRYSYVFLIITIILFPISFADYENAVLVTTIFLLIVNITCFSNEYLVIKYYQKRSQKKQPNKGYALFVMIQVVFTLLLFTFFKIYF